MKFQRPNGGIIAIGKTAIAVMYKHRQLSVSTPEAGGILLGRLISGTDNVIVDVATEPHPADKRGRFFFRRARRPAQQHINFAWKDSGCTCIYLGEWHTHFEDNPVPSRQDLGNWRYIGKKARYEQNFLAFVIVGKTFIRLWEWNKTEKKVYQLVPG